MATIAETRQPPPPPGPASFSRRLFLLGAAGAATLTAAAGAAICTPDRIPPNAKEETPFMLYPALIEKQVKSRLITPLGGNQEGRDARGTIPFLHEAFLTIPLVNELTKIVVPHLYNAMITDRFTIRDATSHAIQTAYSLLSEIRREDVDQQLHYRLESVHFGLMPLMTFISATSFNQNDRAHFGFPPLSLTGDDPHFAKSAVVFGQPGEIRHIVGGMFTTFMYLYSVEHNLDIHTAIPGAIRAKILLKRVTGQYGSIMDEAIDFTETLGGGYEWSNLRDHANWPIVNLGERITDGPFAQDTHIDYEANHRGAVIGAKLFVKARKREPLEPIYEELDHAVRIAA